MSAALSVRGATKRFGAVLALDDVDLDVHHGEVVALLGDNGAGKSTLIKCISGVHRLDAGSIALDGEPVNIPSPAAARAFGIETVYQDLALFDNLSPASNFFAGREQAGPGWLPRPLRVLHRRSMAAATGDVLERLQVSIGDRSANVGLMSGGQRQGGVRRRDRGDDLRSRLLHGGLELLVGRLQLAAPLAAQAPLRVRDRVEVLRDRGDALGHSSSGDRRRGEALELVDLLADVVAGVADGGLGGRRVTGGGPGARRRLVRRVAAGAQREGDRHGGDGEQRGSHASNLRSRRRPRIVRNG